MKNKPNKFLKQISFVQLCTMREQNKIMKHTDLKKNIISIKSKIKRNMKLNATLNDNIQYDGLNNFKININETTNKDFNKLPLYSDSSKKKCQKITRSTTEFK